MVVGVDEQFGLPMWSPSFLKFHRILPIYRPFMSSAPVRKRRRVSRLESVPVSSSDSSPGRKVPPKRQPKPLTKEIESSAAATNIASSGWSTDHLRATFRNRKSGHGSTPAASCHSKRLVKLSDRTRMGEVIKSPNDRREYRVVHLANGLRALLISDLKSLTESTSDDADAEQLSAASLCIHVGSFSDPPDIPGLAHFLEHMVFMGSEKFPDENEFDNFVKLAGGNNNAYTDCERTIFYFDIAQKSFRDGLDRFAQFFIKPLMKQTSCDREIQAVDSEFDMSLTSDSSRKEQLIGSMAKTGHPMGKFMWGNTATLKTIPDQTGIDIYSRLREFHERYYSAHYMTLAVQSKDELDTLEEWVTAIFSDIPNNQKEQPSFEDQQLPFDEVRFHKMYKAIPVKNVHQVEITWQLPNQLKHYREKPLGYLGFLVGHEGKGSILSYLKNRLLALTLAAGNSEKGFEHNSTLAMFAVSCTLTPKGLDNLQEVITTIFQYLDMLRREGPQEQIFKEIQTIEANDFRWQEQQDPVDYVETLCENMQLFPPEHYLTGDTQLYDYDGKRIQEILSELVPSKANILLYSRKFHEDCIMREPWFDTPYTVSEIPPEWESAWEKLEPNSGLHLPAENMYIATDFSIKEPDADLTEDPVLLSDTEQSKLWYKKDDKFKVPKAYIQFLLSSPCVAATPLSFATFDLFLHVLRQNLAEIAYAADAAQLSYTISGNSQGLLLKCSGFNHKLPKLFETVIEKIADFTVEEELFDTLKEQLRRVYYNKAINPTELCRDVRLSVLQQPCWTIVDRQQCLKHVTMDTLLTFVKNFKSQLFVEGLIHGNFTAQEARDMESYMLKRIGCEELPSIAHPQVRVSELPPGEMYIRVENFNRSDSNSVIVNYYQHGPGNIPQTVLNELLNMRMEEPCFDILRTREQLGYSVYCTNHITEGIIGTSITVCSQANKFSMEALDGQIEKFLEEFHDIALSISEDEFRELVQSLVTLKRCEDTCMGEEVGRHWSEIVTQTYLFDRIPRQIAYLVNQVTYASFCEWLQSTLPPGANYRKLSTQVVGNPDAKTRGPKRCEAKDDSDSEGGPSEDGSGDEGEAEDEDEDEEEDDEEEEAEGPGESDEMEIEDEMWDRTTHLVFSPTEEALQEKTITNIRKFCDSLSLYPDTKIL